MTEGKLASDQQARQLKEAAVQAAFFTGKPIFIQFPVHCQERFESERAARELQRPDLGFGT